MMPIGMEISKIFPKQNFLYSSITSVYQESENIYKKFFLFLVLRSTPFQVLELTEVVKNRETKIKEHIGYLFLRKQSIEVYYKIKLSIYFWGS